MKNESQPSEDAWRSAIRAARPAPALPPRFQEDVWRRIEHDEESLHPRVSWLDKWIEYLLRPRLAVTMAVGLVLFSGTLGAWHETARSKSTAQARYLSAVLPHTHP